MKPYCFSAKASQMKHSDWEQCGENIKFGPTVYQYGFLEETFKKVHTLSFEYEFEYENDEV